MKGLLCGCAHVVINPFCYSGATIEYHYGDDSPRNLLPRVPGEYVLVLDYDPTTGAEPIAHSLSKDIAVLGVKVSKAPGAAILEEGIPQNDNMYLLETTTNPEEMCVYC